MKTGSNRKRPTSGRKTRDGRNAGFKSFNSVRKPKNVKNSNRKTRSVQKPTQGKSAFDINFGTELNLPIRKVSQKPTRFSTSSKNSKNATTRKKAENVKIIPIGGLDEIGVTLNAAGYIHPWNSASQIHFPGNGYENCSLCKKYDCIRRRAPFDLAEYRRVFGINP